MYVVKNENNTKVQLAKTKWSSAMLVFFFSNKKEKENRLGECVEKPCGIWVAKGDEIVANANSWLP